MKRHRLIVVRRLLGLVASLSLLFGLSVASAPLAHAAVGAGCWSADTPGVIYPDWHGQTSFLVRDSWPGGNPTHYILTDLWSYRLTFDGGDGFYHCARTMYASGWSNDGSGGNFQAALTFKVCGTAGNQYFGSNVWGSRNFVVFDGSSASPAPPGVYSFTGWNTFPDTVQRYVWWLDYGVTPCLPDGDQASTKASSTTWDVNPISSSGFTAQLPWLWRCRFSNGVVCGS